MPTDPTLDRAKLRRDAEEARQAGDAKGLSRILLLERVIEIKAAEGRTNAFFSCTLSGLLDDLDRAETALREIIDHPARDECEGDDLRSIARAALAESEGGET